MGLQACCFDFADDTRRIEDEKQLALLARYQAQNERGMNKCVNMLAKFRAAHKKEQIGFESQIRKEDAETRKKEAHEARLRLINARARHIEVDSDVRRTCEISIARNMRIPLRNWPPVFAAQSAK
jgi:hypothetical protein